MNWQALGLMRYHHCHLNLSILEKPHHPPQYFSTECCWPLLTSCEIYYIDIFIFKSKASSSFTMNFKDCKLMSISFSIIYGGQACYILWHLQLALEFKEPNNKYKSHECHAVSNLQHLDFLCNILFKLTAKETSNICITCPLWRESIDDCWFALMKGQ